MLVSAGGSLAGEITFEYFAPNANSVGVAGEFSNWEPLAMTKDDTGAWTRTLDLQPGLYGYKFVVDGTEWVFDPKNPQRKTVGGVENSAISVGGVGPASLDVARATDVEVTFEYRNPDARTVHLAGEFNHWLENIDGKVEGKTEWLMQSDGEGNWKFRTRLRPGRHKYKYVINGGEKWETDPNRPTAPDRNSILDVAGPDGQVPDKPGTAPVRGEGSMDVAFSIAAPAAREVFIAGDFNEWSMTANPLQKNDEGVWSILLPLKPGQYQYKFIVDGVWKADPSNSEMVEDQHGGSNSVKIVTP